MERLTTTVTIVVDPLNDVRAEYDAKALEVRALGVELGRISQRDTEALEVKEAEVHTAEAELEAIGERVKEGIAVLTLTSLSYFEYMGLLRDNPPRGGDDLDERFGYNVDTFAKALLKKATVKAEKLSGGSLALDVDTWVSQESGVSAGDFQTWFEKAMSMQTTASVNFRGRGF